jgi:cyclophilin family peptidyl-prolyl cis-trans isomerase
MKNYISLFFCLLLPAISVSVLAKPFVDIQTNHGTITIELKPEQAPVTVNNFLKYVDANFYDNTIFHRVIKDFMIQGGGFDANLVEQTNVFSPIALESNNGLKNLRGTIAMARTSAPNSATAQFFINSVDNDFLNYQSSNNPGYAVFGSVRGGIMDVVDSINAVNTGLRDIPAENVIIETIRPRESHLSMSNLKANYAVGDVIKVSLAELGIKRDRALDLWVAILLPNNKFVYLVKRETFSFTPVPYKSSVNPESTYHQILNFTIPQGLAGHYSFFALFNEAGSDISDLTHSLRSNIAHVETDLSKK